MGRSDREGAGVVAGREPALDAARKRAAVETYARHQAALRRTASRYSICDDDADDALQRGLEILLRKAPSNDPRELVRWTQTVVKHEALAIRRERERILAGPAGRRRDQDAEDWVALIPAPEDGPAERTERREAIARSREALLSLKPPELRALTLLAEGYSYREIGEITGFSATKINRSLAEGRERFRRFLARSDAGERCAELQPLISAFCDGEAAEAESAALREHLRACAHCRSTLRAYRAAPRAAAALAPVLPVSRSLLDRAQDAVAALAGRFGGGGTAADSSLTQIAATGGTRGAGVAALAKVLAICAGTVGGAAACVATGVVPDPIVLVDNEPAVTRSAPAQTGAERDPQPQEAVTETSQTPPAEEETAQPDHEHPEPAASETPVVPETSGGAVEYTPPPPPAASGTSSAPSSTGSAASAAPGEFGP
jgi:RNA polymerase sigma factor (sigma-70 family)